MFFRDFLSIYKIEDIVVQDVLIGSNTKDYKNVLGKFSDANREVGKPLFANIPEKYDSLTLIITRNCNLNCKYCFAVNSKEKTKDMTVDTAKKSIDALLSTSPNLQGYVIYFFGGEPLINFNLLSEIVEYARNEIITKRGKKVWFSITTNGVVLNDKIVKFLIKNNFSILISIDGTKQAHDKNRVFRNGKGSFDIVMKNAMELKANNKPFSFRATIDPYTDIFETVSGLESFKIPFSFELTFDTKLKDTNITSYKYTDLNNIKENYQKIIDYYYNKILNKEEIYCIDIKLALNKIINRWAKNISCTSGRSALSVMPDGSLLSCLCSQNFKELYFNNIQNIDFLPPSNLKALRVDDLNECKECWLKYLCGGGCYYEKYVESGDITIPSYHHCNILNIVWESMISLYLRLQATDKLINLTMDDV